MMHEFISDEKLSREKNFNFISFLISAKPFGKGGACIHTHTYRFFFPFYKNSGLCETYCKYIRSSHQIFFVFLFKSALLRCNLHAIKCIHLKCTI